MPTISGTVTNTSGNPASGYTVRFYRRDTGALLGETLTGTGSAGAADPDWASVLVLLRGNTAAAGPFINDAPWPVTYLGNGCAISSAVTVAGFGNQIKLTPVTPIPGSPTFSTDGLPAYVQDTASTFAPLAASTSFTLEGFVQFLAYNTNNASKCTFWSLTNTAATFTAVKLELSSSGRISIVSGGTATAASTVITPGTRHFLRLTGVSDGSNCTLSVYVDGVLNVTYTRAVAADTVSTLTLNASSAAPTSASAVDVNAYMEEIRLTAGVLRSTPAIPTAQWPTNVQPPAVTAGAYSFITPYTGEVNVVCLDNAGGTVENDLILRTNVT